MADIDIDIEIETERKRETYFMTNKAHISQWKKQTQMKPEFI